MTKIADEEGDGDGCDLHGAQAFQLISTGVLTFRPDTVSWDIPGLAISRVLHRYGEGVLSGFSGNMAKGSSRDRRRDSLKCTFGTDLQQRDTQRYPHERLRF